MKRIINFVTDIIIVGAVLIMLLTLEWRTITTLTIISCLLLYINFIMKIIYNTRIHFIMAKAMRRDCRELYGLTKEEAIDLIYVHEVNGKRKICLDLVALDESTKIPMHEKIEILKSFIENPDNMFAIISPNMWNIIRKTKKSNSYQAGFFGFLAHILGHPLAKSIKMLWIDLNLSTRFNIKLLKMMTNQYFNDIIQL